MRPVLLLLVALALSEPDSSWRGREIDLTKIELVRSFGPWKPSTLSPAGNALALYAGNSIRLIDVAQEKESRKLTGNLNNIHDSGWSRDGRVFASAG